MLTVLFGWSSGPVIASMNGDGWSTYITYYKQLACQLPVLSFRFPEAVVLIAKYLQDQTKITYSATPRLISKATNIARRISAARSVGPIQQVSCSCWLCWERALVSPLNRDAVFSGWVRQVPLHGWKQPALLLDVGSQGFILHFQPKEHCLLLTFL